MKATVTTIANNENMAKIPNNGYAFTPKRGLIEIGQAIANVTRQNTDGRYNERLMLLEIEKRDTESYWRAKTQNAVVRDIAPYEVETAAIMAFNADRRFTITE